MRKTKVEKQRSGEEKKKHAGPPCSQSDGNVNSLYHHIHYLVAEGALSKAVRALVTYGFQLPDNADQQVKQPACQSSSAVGGGCSRSLSCSGTEMKLSDCNVDVQIVAGVVTNLRHDSAPCPSGFLLICCVMCGGVVTRLLRICFQSSRRISPYQAMANAVPVPNKMDREESARQGEEILIASSKVRSITLEEMIRRVFSSSVLVRAQPVFRKECEQFGFGISDASGQLAFLHTSLITAASNKYIPSIL